jgi:hypothetical protein
MSSRKSQRKKLRKPLIEAELSTRKRKENRERVNYSNLFRRTLVAGISYRHVIGIGASGAADLYRQNWEGCRALWTQSYRQKKAQRLSQSAKL